MSNLPIQKSPTPDQLPANSELYQLPPGYELKIIPPGQRGADVHLWHYIHQLWRRRWLVAFLLALCLSLSVLHVMRATPIYEAKASIRIEPEVPKMLGLEDGQLIATSKNDLGFINTQLKVLESRSLARRVVESLGLYQPEEGEEEKGKGFGIGAVVAWVKGFVKPAKADKNAPVDPADAEQDALGSRVSAFLANMDVKQLPDSQVVEVIFRDKDRKRAAEVANALCKAYVRSNHEMRASSYQYAREWLDDTTKELQGKLEQSEEKLQQFAGGQDVLTFGNNLEDLNKQLEETGSKLSEAENTMLQKEFAMRTAKSGGLTSGSAGSNAALQGSIAELGKLEVERDRLIQNLGPKSQEVKELDGAISRKKQQIAEERGRMVEFAGAEYETVKNNYTILNESYRKQRDRIADLQQKMIQYNILKREADVNRQMYDNLLQKAKGVTVASSLEASNATVIEAAEPPIGAKYPRKGRTVGLGAFLGLILGVGLVFFLDYMDTTVKGPKDLEQQTNLATLGVLPHFVNGKNGSNGHKGRKHAPRFLIDAKVKSAYAEHMKDIRTALVFSQAERAPKTMLVTSAFPGEGKTTVAANLAIAYAQRGQKVLLLDADLKNPSIHRMFNVERRVGLTDLLAGRSKANAIRKTAIDNLYLLTCGTKAPNPVELLDSQIMRDLLATLSEQVDVIVIDSAPLLGMADTKVLVPYVDGTVLVVRPGVTPIDGVEEARALITAMRGRILGVVMNNPRGRSNEFHSYSYKYAYGYRYKYGYGYGYGRDSDDDETDEETREALTKNQS